MNAQSIIEAIASNIQGQVELNEVKASITSTSSLATRSLHRSKLDAVGSAHRAIDSQTLAWEKAITGKLENPDHRQHG